MQNHLLNNFKFYEGINEENIRKEIKELTKKGHEVFDIKTIELNNQFILFYNKKDVTQPSEADLAKPTFQSVVEEPEPKNTVENIIVYAKKYWILSLAVGGALFYYFIIYKG